MLAKLAKEALPKLGMEREKVKIVSRMLSHVEHAGGVLVGVEFAFPHVLAASQLAATFVGVFLLHVIAGGDA